MISLAVAAAGWVGVSSPGDYAAIQFLPLPRHDRGAFLSWLFYYQGVIEPVSLLHYLKINHPALQATFRDYDTMLRRIDEALADGPFLLGQDFSAADLLCVAPFLFFGDMMPVTPAMRDWVARCGDRMA